MFHGYFSLFVSIQNTARSLLKQFYLAMQQAQPRWISELEALRISKALRASLNCYSALAKEAFVNRRKRWAYRPKMHQLYHMSSDVLYELWNPRSYHGFSDEDFIGQIKCLARRVHIDTLELRVIQRYLLRLLCAWEP